MAQKGVVLNLNTEIGTSGIDSVGLFEYTAIKICAIRTK